MPILEDRLDHRLTARELKGPCGELGERLLVAGARCLKGQIDDDLAVTDQVDQQWSVIAAVGGHLTDPDDLGLGLTTSVEPAQRPLATADRHLVLALLGHVDQMPRVVLAGDELVDEPGGWCTRSSHEAGPDAVGVDGGSAQRGDCMLIKIRGDDNPSASCSQPVQLSSDLARLDEKVPRIEPHGTETDTGDFDGEADWCRDAVVIDEQGGF